MATLPGIIIVVPSGQPPIPMVGPGQVVVSKTLANEGLEVTATATVLATIVNNGGFLSVDAGGVALGTTINAGGNEGVNGGRETAPVIGAGGSLGVTSGTVDGAMVTSGGLLTVAPGAVAINTNLQPGGQADFAGIAYPYYAVATLDAVTDILTFSSPGGISSAVQLAGSYAGDTFTFVRDAQSVGGQSGSGTLISFSGPANAASVPQAGNIIALNTGSVTTAFGTVNSVSLGLSDCSVVSHGQDTIYGGGGAGIVSATGNDLVVGGAGALTFNGGAGHSVLFGGVGGLVYSGGTGSDVVVGLGGNRIFVIGGSGGGQYFGSGGSTITAGSGASAVMVGSNGDRLFSAGAAGDLFGAGATGDVYMSGVHSSGNDVFFGASGTGSLTFIAGSGNDIMGMGQGQNIVQLGSGNSAVFAATGKTGVTSITGGGGSAVVGCGGASVTINVGTGAAPENYALYNFRSMVDHVRFAGQSADTVNQELASQTTSAGSTSLTLADKSVLTFVGMGHLDIGMIS